MTTPVISPDRGYFIYGGTADAYKGLHSAMNIVFVYDVKNERERIVAKDKISWFSISGWVDNNIEKSDVININEEESSLEKRSSNSLLQPSFKLPWSSGSSYCVTRTGSGNGFTFPATCGTTICGSYSGDHGYEAIDFNLGLNTTVLAAAGGTVVFAWFNATGTDPITGGYGNLVKIRHSDGTYA